MKKISYANGSPRYDAKKDMWFCGGLHTTDPFPSWNSQWDTCNAPMVWRGGMIGLESDAHLLEGLYCTKCHQMYPLDLLMEDGAIAQAEKALRNARKQAQKAADKAKAERKAREATEQAELARAAQAVRLVTSVIGTVMLILGVCSLGLF